MALKKYYLLKKYYALIVLLLFSLLLSLLFSTTSIAGGHSSSPSKIIKLTAGADPWPPYIDESLPLGGVSVQIADAAFRTQGFTVENKILPWARAIEETKHARIDLILDAWWSQERSKHFMFSRPYINGPIKFIQKKGNNFKYNGLGSLEGQSIVLVRNYAYGDAFLNATNYQRYYAHNFLQSMQMLMRDRVKLTLENELVARTRIAQDAPHMLEHIEWVETPLSDALVYIMCGYKNLRHIEIIAAFNKGLSAIIENGKYAEIMKTNDLAVPDIFSK